MLLVLTFLNQSARSHLSSGDKLIYCLPPDIKISAILGLRTARTPPVSGANRSWWFSIVHAAKLGTVAPVALEQ
jgi:hypothetical protein